METNEPKFSLEKSDPASVEPLSKLILVEDITNFCRDFINYRLAVDTEYEPV